MEDCSDLVTKFHADLNNEISSDTLNFPTSFDISSRISKMINDPNISLREIANLVQSEPLLFAKVLRTANSPNFNPGPKLITNSFSAVQRLGVKKLRCLVYLISMEQLHSDSRSTEIKSIASIVWKHSLDVGCWAYSIAKHTKLVDPDLALLTGLMVDIGQFFILSKFHEYPGIEANFDVFTDIVVVRYEDTTKQILDILKLPKEIMEVYECMYLQQPNWPVNNLTDIFLLATILTEVPNPLLSVIEKYKRKIFYNDMDEDQTTALNYLVADIFEIKQNLFNTLSNVS